MRDNNVILECRKRMQVVNKLDKIPNINRMLYIIIKKNKELRYFRII